MKLALAIGFSLLGAVPFPEVHGRQQDWIYDIYLDFNLHKIIIKLML
jgi:hypothetical protein